MSNASPAGGLTALKTNPPGFTTADAERIARELYGIDAGATLLFGERDQNFRLRPAQGPGAVLKLYNAHEDPAIVDFQIKALDHLALQDPGLPVPRLLATRAGERSARIEGPDGAGHIACAITFLPGKLLEDVQPDAALLRDIGRTVARLDKALRGFFHPAAGQKIAWDIRRAGELRPFASLIGDPAVAAAVARVLERTVERLPAFAALRGQVIHNDCNPGNVLVDAAGAPAVAGIIDFGDMIHGPLMFDLALAAAEAAGEGMGAIESAQEVIAGYSAVLPLQEDEIALLFDAIAARFASTFAIFAWRQRHDRRGADKLERFERSELPVFEQLLSAGPQAAANAFRKAAGLSSSLPVAATPKPPAQMPGASSEALIARRRRLLGSGLELSYERPVHLLRGEGVWLWDADGRRYLDAYNNVPNVGHAHPHVVEAVARQSALLNTNTRYLHETVLDYAERLCARMPAGLEVCAFVNCGSEANDIAWRIAKAHTGGTGALVMENAYHGGTEAVAALSPYGVPASDVAPHVRTLEAPDLYRGRFRASDPGAASGYAEAADRALASLMAAGHRPAAAMIDSAFISSGILDLPKGYLQAVAEKVRAAGGLFIADEVQYGFGRSGSHFWGFDFQGAVPDIVTMGKPVGNGHPLGVVVTRREILKSFTDRTDYFSTFGGNPVSAAAGLAVLEVLEREGLQENARATGAYFRQGVEALMARHAAIGDVRGTGLVMGVELVRDRKTQEPAPDWTRRVANLMREQGVLIGTEGPRHNVLKIRPPLCFRREHADIAIEALDRALAAI
ncbi:MAG TPA: aminotransferase class III-fold pyridoxal phosphate-dependent enzyme [Hypericibacter adhaerens]|uniref:aminotransferase class III-fold pyridoxal phosphate-dependent enzyme n=1 Tax=Hypericibacter adhaerens TaxID=2602016 RepID=UPI002C06D8C9|nr:aminotransferase class III-fold pyridoxal phosphate-dependent enzyme [Hypericibacter adhaerens]HWA45272.1 aminotransferase class III-fold pyridoxal phosphate-dependent enzyme [Hypericibacter adhaerens]